MIDTGHLANLALISSISVVRQSLPTLHQRPKSLPLEEMKSGMIALSTFFHYSRIKAIKMLQKLRESTEHESG